MSPPNSSCSNINSKSNNNGSDLNLNMNTNMNGSMNVFPTSTSASSSSSSPMPLQQQIPLIVPPMPLSSSSYSPPSISASTTSPPSPSGGGGSVSGPSNSGGSHSSANTSTNKNSNNANISILSSPVGISASSEQLSPSSAALSTAAAVAAISSCFSNATIPTTTATSTVTNTDAGTGTGTCTGIASSNNSNSSNINTSSSSNIHVSSSSSKGSASNSNHNNIDASSTIMLSIPIIAPPVPNTASASNTTTTIPNQQGFNQHGYGSANHLQTNQNQMQNQQRQQSAGTAAPEYHQNHPNQNCSISNGSRPNSNSNTSTPCPTPGPPASHCNLFQHQSSNVSSSSSMTPCPGPLAPPPSRLLAHPPPMPSSSAAPGTTTPSPSASGASITSSSNSTNTMLPQNQLIYNHIPVPMPISMAAPSPSMSAVSVNSVNNSTSASSTNTATTAMAGKSNTSYLHPGARILSIVPPPASTTSSTPAAPASSTLYRHQPRPQPQQQQQQQQQQQRNSITTTTSSFRPRNVQIATPGIFANMTLRRGKWTPEEERFANALIKEFEKGTILDCENGCTLRAYLSRKLHCAPMRISKKYAGKSIGKHVFLSRIPSIMNSRNGIGGVMGDVHGGQGGSNGTMRSTQHNLDRIRDLEFHFHMSLLQEGAGCGLGPNIGKGLSSVVAGGRPVTANVMNCVQGRHGQASVLPRSSVAGTPVANGGLGANGNNGSFPMIFPSPHSSVSNFCQNGTSSSGSNSFLNIASQNMAAAPNASTTFQWFAPGPVNANAPGPSPSITNSSNVSAPSTTMQMQETLFNAFKEAQNSNTHGVATAIQPPQFHITLSPSSNNAAIQGLTDQGHQNGKTQVNGNDSNNVTNESSINNTFAVGGNQNNVSDLFTTANFHDTGNSNNTTIESNMNGVISESKEEDNEANISTSQAQQNWLSETMHIIPTLDPSSYMGQFSPTYTSQSFDDLHQFIGKDCPPSTSTTNQQTTTAGIEGPATDAANKLEQSANVECDMSSTAEIGKYSNSYVSVADSYALFAQQSAMAVSKHSAYANPLPSSNVTPSTGISSGVNIAYGNTNTSTANANEIYPPTSSSNIGSATPKEQQVEIPLPSSSCQVLNTGVKGEDISNVDSSSLKVKDEKIIPASKNLRRARVKQEEDSSATSAAFSAANLQLHSAAVEEMERSDKNANTECSRTNVSENVPNTSSVLRHTNIVSGSDRSGSDNGSESLSAGGSGSSGSENTSDNSDTASDEGRSSSNASANGRSKLGGNSKRRQDLDGSQDAKRQKICTSANKETMH